MEIWYDTRLDEFDQIEIAKIIFAKLGLEIYAEKSDQGHCGCDHGNCYEPEVDVYVKSKLSGQQFSFNYYPLDGRENLEYNEKDFFAFLGTLKNHIPHELMPDSVRQVILLKNSQIVEAHNKIAELEKDLAELDNYVNGYNRRD